MCYIFLLVDIASSIGFAGTSIDVGVHNLQPNTPGQEITLFAVGDAEVSGFNLRAQIGDGLGPLFEPQFEAVSFASGIWEKFEWTTVGGPVVGASQFAQASVVFNAVGQTAVANGQLVKLVLNTVGVNEGTFDLLLSVTEIGEDSDFIFPGGQTLTPAISNGVLRIGPEAVLGDFDGNGLLETVDVDALTTQIAGGGSDLLFDVNTDNAVDSADLTTWVKDLKNTWIGDANLDGEFNSTDLVEVFQAGEFENETSGDSVWTSGDWNGDGDFTTADFVSAFQDGGFEFGPRVHSVPEPFGWLLSAITILGLVARRSMARFVTC